jgi:hypothetical protein
MTLTPEEGRRLHVLTLLEGKRITLTQAAEGSRQYRAGGGGRPSTRAWPAAAQLRSGAGRCRPVPRRLVAGVCRRPPGHNHPCPARPRAAPRAETPMSCRPHPARPTVWRGVGRRTFSLIYDSCVKEAVKLQLTTLGRWPLGKHLPELVDQRAVETTSGPA